MKLRGFSLFKQLFRNSCFFFVKTDLHFEKYLMGFVLGYSFLYCNGFFSILHLLLSQYKIFSLFLFKKKSPYKEILKVYSKNVFINFSPSDESTFFIQLE